MAAGKTRPTAFKNICQHCVLMDIAHEEPAAVFFRECVGQIKASATVSRFVPMVRDRFYVIKDIGIKVSASLSVITAAVNDVPQMWYHTGRKEHLAVIVEIHAPGITCAPGKHFKFLFDWMVSPDARINRRAFMRGGAWLSDF